MFDFLKPCLKQKGKKKQTFEASHTLTIHKGPEGKTVQAVVTLTYEVPVQKIAAWSTYSLEFSSEREHFNSSKQVETYIERLGILIEHLREVKCAMKAEE